MKRTLITIHSSLVQFGIDPLKFARAALQVPAFVRDVVTYRRKLSTEPEGLSISSIYPILIDRAIQAGDASGHYFHQDLWAAQKIFKRNPARHVDIGSSIDGFISHLLVFRSVEVVDIRPLPNVIPGLSFIRSDATNLREFPDSSLESISTLHAAEHFGLGRYGDPIDPVAHLRFMKALARVLMPGGRLYFGVPSGKERLYFNANRVISPQTILRAFAGLTLVSFSCVKDDGRLYADCNVSEVAQEDYGCGLFEFTK